MRKTIIAGNWKMNHLGADAKETIQGLVAKVPQDADPCRCPEHALGRKRRFHR